MDILLKFLIGVTIILIIIINYTYVYDGTDWFSNDINNKYYRVKNGNNTNKKIRSNLLAVLDDKLNIIVNSLSNGGGNGGTNGIAVNRLIHTWNRGVTIKETGNMESDAAYVVNKQYMSFCLKNFCNGTDCDGNISLENINLLTYVGIHELSHIMSDEIGHGDEFKTNFKYLLAYAKNLKYKELPLYVDLTKLKKTPEKYCGVSIINSIS